MGVKLQSSSGGSVDITAPVTASNYVLTAPAANGTILSDASSLAAAMLTGNVDVARLVSAFSGSNVSLSSSGYQKLPSGLIIQWGKNPVAARPSTTTINFPVAFPSGCVSIAATYSNPTDAVTLYMYAAEPISAAQFRMSCSAPSYGAPGYWIAIGY